MFFDFVAHDREQFTPELIAELASLVPFSHRTLLEEDIRKLFPEFTTYKDLSCSRNSLKAIFLMVTLCLPSRKNPLIIEYPEAGIHPICQSTLRRYMDKASKHRNIYVCTAVDLFKKFETL